MANVRARVEEHCHELAIDCACAVAVGRGSCAKMDDALKSYRANCLTKGSESTDYSAEENASWHLAGYQSIRNTLAQMIADNDPRDVTEGMLKVAAAMFGQIKGEEERAQQCLVLAEQARQKVIYEKASARRAAIGMPDLMDAADLEALAKQFGQIPGYKDAKRQAEQCLQDAENVRENAYNDAVKAMQEAERSSCKWREAIQMLAREGLNGYRDVEELRKQGEQLYEECRNAEEKERKAKERKNKRLTVAFVLVVLIACVVGWFVVTRVIPNNKYQRAVTLRENGQYDDAIAAFAELGDYSDAAAQITETKYQQAVSLREAGEYESAIAVFASLNDYRDAETQIEEMKQEKYQQAVTLRENGQYEEAIAAFEKLGDYSDAEVKIKEIKYQQAMALRRSGQYDEAIAAFTALGNYGDAEMQIKEVKYQQAVELRENGQYDDAIVAFTELKDYSDAKTQIAEMKYQQGKAFLNVMDYDNAARILITIKGYKDVDKLLTENDDIMAISAEIMLDTKFTVGNYVTFGTYPQTALGNDQTPIEWLVLARDGRQALLISRYGLDAKPYNTKLSSTTWGKCTLRTWLNDTFLNKAFSSTEQTAILQQMLTTANSSVTVGGIRVEKMILKIKYSY